MPRKSIATLAATTALFSAPAFADPPKIVATIGPVHSLVSMVTEGIAEPLLLIEGNASPHDFAMKPSDAKALSEAGVVFLADEQMETFIGKPLSNRRDTVRVVSMAGAPGAILLAGRDGGIWEGHAEEHGHEEHGHDEHGHDEHGHDDHAHDEHGHDEHGHDDHGHKDEHAHGDGHDSHLWLDPENAMVFVRHASAVLGEADPANKDTYAANAEKAVAALSSLDSEIKAELTGVADKPYLVFHDAYQYFEKRYGLSAAGSVTIDPERKPGAKRLSKIRERIEHGNIACVFREPQFAPALVDTVARGTEAKIGVLDPLGADIPPGVGQYPALIRALSANLRYCLAG